MIVTIFQVADYFRYRTDYDEGDNITQLKLQKLCYYAQAWHLALYNKPLFENEFLKWEHGPCNRELWEFYNSNKGNPIPQFDIKVTFDPNQIFSLSQLIHLDEVWNNYGCYTGSFLRYKTHSEDPWIKTDENKAISNDSMAIFYQSELKKEVLSMEQEQIQYDDSDFKPLFTLEQVLSTPAEQVECLDQDGYNKVTYEEWLSLSNLRERVNSVWLETGKE